MPTLQPVFVYGSLKRGCSNHLFLERATFFGEAWTVERYELLVDEYPLVYEGNAVGPIRGEVYGVDQPLLTRIDLLEQHPDFYRRRKVPVRLDDGRILEAWLYFFPRRLGVAVPSGDWSPECPGPDHD